MYENMIKYIFKKNTNYGICHTLNDDKESKNITISEIILPQLGASVNSMLDTDHFTLTVKNKRLYDVVYSKEIYLQKFMPESEYSLLNYISNSVSDELKISDILFVKKIRNFYYLFNSSKNLDITIDMSVNMSILITGSPKNTNINIKSEDRFGPLLPKHNLRAVISFGNLNIPAEHTYYHTFTEIINPPKKINLSKNMCITVIYTDIGLHENIIAEENFPIILITVK